MGDCRKVDLDFAAFCALVCAPRQDEAMAEPDPPVPWPGYAPGIEEIISAGILPGERRLAGPMDFDIPASAPLYPQVRSAGHPACVVVTDAALYTFRIDRTHAPFEVGHTRSALSEFHTVIRSVRQRVNKVNGKRRTEWVLLLQLVFGDGSTLAIESRFEGASQVADVLERAVAATQSSGGAGGSTASMADELAKLSDLAAQGVLSHDDWERAKQLYLGKPPDRRAGDTQLLSQLHDLYRAGALSESEFNSKKWEILSRS